VQFNLSITWKWNARNFIIFISIYFLVHNFFSDRKSSYRKMRRKYIIIVKFFKIEMTWRRIEFWDRKLFLDLNFLLDFIIFYVFWRIFFLVLCLILWWLDLLLFYWSFILTRRISFQYFYYSFFILTYFCFFTWSWI
jgi:hypothetical protein